MVSKFTQNIRHPLVANSFYLYLAHFADYLLLLLILPFIARVLGPSALGEVGLAQTFGLFILLLMEFGFPLMATRQVARIKDDVKQLKDFVSELFMFKLFLIPVALFLSFLAIWTVPVFKNNPHYILITSFGAIFQSLSPIWFFQGIEKIRTIAISKTVFRILGFLIIFYYVRSSQDGWIILLAYSLSSVLICGYLLAYMTSIIGRFHLSSFKKVWAIFRKTQYSFLITILPAIYNNLGIIILSTIVTPLQLGYYYGAARIHRALNTLYGPVGQTLYPHLASMGYTKNDQTKKVIKKFLWFMLAIAILFCMGLYFFAHLLIQVLLGPEFFAAEKTLKLFGVVLPLTAISHVLGRQWLMVADYERQYSNILTIASLVGMISIIVLIKPFGILSIPLSLIIFESLTIVLILFILRQNTLW